MTSCNIKKNTAVASCGSTYKLGWCFVAVQRSQLAILALIKIHNPKRLSLFYISLDWLNTVYMIYLLGLLAMIKCSICSYQCDNWYVSNWRLACHIYFSLGRCSLELAQGPSGFALASHPARSSTPFWVTKSIYLWKSKASTRLNALHAKEHVHICAWKPCVECPKWECPQCYRLVS